MKHKLIVTIENISENEYMARAEAVRATALGETPEDAIKKLQDSIDEMVKEFGAELVFKDINRTQDYRLVEVGI